jgi:hypothetical protein
MSPVILRLAGSCETSLSMPKGLKLEVAPDGTRNQLSPESSLARAFLLLREMESRYLPVKICEEWVGVISMHEIGKVMKEYQPGRESQGARPRDVGHYMRAPIKVLDSNGTAVETLKEMAFEAAHCDFQAFVVLRPEQAPGVVTRQDLLAFLASLLESPPKAPESYSEQLEKVMKELRELGSQSALEESTRRKRS